jgi:hypothetical protein
MRVSIPTLPARSRRRPPDRLEQLLGRRRARVLRRRLGLLALGAGVTLLKPRTRWKPVLVAAAIAVVVWFAFGTLIG